MELVLNLAWLMLAVSMVVVWLHLTPQARQDRRLQFVALALVILVLLPAISVTDDLIVACSPAEIDSNALRRGHHWDYHHVVLPVQAALVVAVFRGLNRAPRPALMAANQQILILRAPALSSVANRPPPAA